MKTVIIDLAKAEQERILMENYTLALKKGEMSPEF